MQKTLIFVKKLHFPVPLFRFLSKKVVLFQTSKFYAVSLNPLRCKGFGCFGFCEKSTTFFSKSETKSGTLSFCTKHLFYCVFYAISSELCDLSCDIVRNMKSIGFEIGLFLRAQFLTSPKIGLYLAQNWVNFEYFLNEEN